MGGGQGALNQVGPGHHSGIDRHCPGGRPAQVRKAWWKREREAKPQAAATAAARSGMQRIAVESGDPDLLVIGFVAKDGRRTLVLVNRSAHPRRIDLGPWHDLPRWEYSDAQHANAGMGAPGDAGLLLHPGAVVTGTDLHPQILPAEFVAP